MFGLHLRRRYLILPRLDDPLWAAFLSGPCTSRLISRMLRSAGCLSPDENVRHTRRMAVGFTMGPCFVQNSARQRG